MSNHKLMFLVRGFDDSVKNTPIGNAVWIERIDFALREAIWKQNWNSEQAAWIDLFSPAPTHALVGNYRLSSDASRVEQEILRAILALRLVKPVTIAKHLSVHVTQLPKSPQYILRSEIGFGSQSYVHSGAGEGEPVTTADIDKAASILQNLAPVLENWEQNKRLVRSLKLFEMAHWVNQREVRAPIFYTSLETLLCTHGDYLSQQIKQRVPRICAWVTNAELDSIQSMRGGLVHSGHFKENLGGAEAEEDLMRKLERITRECLAYILSQGERVAVFADDEAIRSEFPVVVDEAVRQPKGRRISI